MTKVDKKFFLDKVIHHTEVTKKVTTQFEVDSHFVQSLLQEIYPDAKITYDEWFCTTFIVEETEND